MKGSEAKLVAYMEGARKRFVIPVYQRNYDWQTENCKQLFNDLEKVIRNRRRSHFFGSIVSVYNPESSLDEFLIIDGQQRLTTVSLLFLAMYNLIIKGIVKPSIRNLGERIFEDYLVDKWQDNDSRIKLKSVKSDSLAFTNLFGDENAYIKDSNLTINYYYFYNRIQKEQLSIDELYEALSRLEIIAITLNQDDNPQLIFESLNSTGVALSEGDKIRNYVLMGLPNKRQTDYYQRYWNPIEVLTDYDVSTFVRDYLSIKQQDTPSFYRIYIAFKSFVEENNNEIEPLLQDLLFYANLYHILLHGIPENRPLDACIYRMNRLETTVTRPLLIEVLRLWKQGKLHPSEATSVFLMTENYLFRRAICDLPTNLLNKIFLLLHREILRLEGNEANYLEKLKYILLNKKDRSRYPNDTEFTESFGSRDVYLMNSKNRTYIFERLENIDTAEDKDLYRHFDDGVYSIEHIMPQQLTPAWQKSLGPDFEQIHALWLHRMANLTITAYNSQYSNLPFREKKEARKGFIDSGIRLNQWIARKEDWGLQELEERSEHLESKALRIWPTPVTQYKPMIKQLDFCTLDDDVDLKGKSIARFNYQGVEQPVTSWIDMFERVLKILHSENKSILLKLAYGEEYDSGMAQYVSRAENSLRKGIEIDEGLYVERNTSTGMKISLLRRFFKLFGADSSGLVFFLRDDSGNENTSTEIKRYDLRKRYWSFALEEIRKNLGGIGPFTEVSPSKNNWINGFIGMRGFHINCIANFDCARVELYLGREREANKSIFDSLLSRRIELEREICGALYWKRNDEGKSSTVYKQLDGVSVANETDWLQMAKFHAEWVKKFFEILVPHLRKMESTD